jgi:hypothetical protein
LVDDKGNTSGGSSIENVASGESAEQELEIVEEVSGYNSGDEYLGQKKKVLSKEEWKMVGFFL